MTQHDRFGGQSFTVLAVEHAARNNIEGGMTALLARLGGARDVGETDYRNRFAAVPLGTPIVPRELPPVRSAGPQTARVVGLPEAAVTLTRDHQVRIQFAWQRGTQPNGGGLADTGSSAFPDGHAPGDAGSGTWVPVAEWLSGRRPPGFE